MKLPLFAVAICALLLGTGCATVVKGTDQKIAVTTSGCDDGTEVRCELSTEDDTYYVVAPGNIEVDKSRKDLAFSCSSKSGATGETVVESYYEAMNAGNILLGGVIGVGVDAISGAMWKYPKAVDVTMTCAGDTAAAAGHGDVRALAETPRSE